MTADIALLKSIEELVNAQGFNAENIGNVPDEIIAAAKAAGIFRYFNPKEAGGAQPHLCDAIAMWEEMARQDPSYGWIGAVYSPNNNFTGSFLPEKGFQEMTRNGNDFLVAGQYYPNGMGDVVEGGYKVTGGWNFGSGTHHADWILAGFLPMNNGELVMATDELPDMMVAVIPREQVIFAGNWDVLGLRGTGSVDYSVADLFVPEHMTFRLFSREPLRGSSIFKIGVMPYSAATLVGVTLGIAKRSLEDIKALAKTKTRGGEFNTIAMNMTFQVEYSRKHAMLSAARALVLSLFDEATRVIDSGAEVSPELRARIRSGSTWAAETCRDVVDFAHRAAGTDSIRRGNMIERAFRDIHTALQHAFLSEKTLVDSGKVLLGVVDDVFSL